MSVKLSGTLIILLGTAIYGLSTDFVNFTPEIIKLLLLLSLLSELGGRILRIYLTKNIPVSRDFSVNSAVCHFGGVLASDALFGSVLGLSLWELVAGKTLLPHRDTIFQVLLRLIGVAVIRFVCGITMIVVTHLYIFR